MDDTTTTYTAMILNGGQPQPRALAEADDDEDDDNGPASGPKSLSSIELAHTAGILLSTLTNPVLRIYYDAFGMNRLTLMLMYQAPLSPLMTVHPSIVASMFII